jgi:aryl-alcohol dehydrogenase-like predicted oxidoreductase
MERRPLGSSGMRVSALSLGSWRTFERIPREAGIAVMEAAREAGIDFLDDARYDDETGTAPISTGYSEVVFGELFRAAGWKRDEVVVANKLWWEFWPEQSPAEELDGSLGRMGFDHLDVVYSATPPDGLPLAELVGLIGELLAFGKLRAWGVLNWEPELVAEATRLASTAGVAQPCAAQLPYSLASPEHVESPAVVDALGLAGAGVVASFVLAGGALSGKYVAGGRGRLSETSDNPPRRRSLRVGELLRSRADELGTTPSRLALAFALANPRVASVLFGATSPEQVRENAGALETLAALGEGGVEGLRELASSVE